jgi:hypothetical protein
VTSHHIASSYHITSSPHHIVTSPHHITYHITLHHITYHITSHYITSHHHITLHRIVISHHIASSLYLYVELCVTSRLTVWLSVCTLHVLNFFLLPQAFILAHVFRGYFTSSKNILWQQPNAVLEVMGYVRGQLQSPFAFNACIFCTQSNVCVCVFDSVFQKRGEVR